MPAYTVRCVKIEKSSDKKDVTWIDTYLRGLPSGAKTDSAATTGAPLVKTKATGPLTYVTLLGCLLSIALFIVSIVLGDGMSLLATILLSLLSTVVGISNKWTLKLPKPADGKKPAGDAVIRYPKGSYLVVKCEESVARELFFAPEEIEYNVASAATYRLISLLGTLMLMLGVIALANARLPLQFAWAGAYIIINIAQWISAAMPSEAHWDLSCYTLEEEGLSAGPHSGNFTEALWKAILLTKSIDWVTIGGAAPATEVWKAWLGEAWGRSLGVGSHTGKLQDPLYSRGHGSVHDDPKDWDPKGEWDLLNKQYLIESEEKQTRGLGAPRRW